MITFSKHVLADFGRKSGIFRAGRQALLVTLAEEIVGQRLNRRDCTTRQALSLMTDNQGLLGVGYEDAGLALKVHLVSTDVDKKAMESAKCPTSSTYRFAIDTLFISSNHNVLYAGNGKTGAQALFGRRCISIGGDDFLEFLRRDLSENVELV